ncbi:glycosyltransferase [Ramlibacter monticola]|uniref:Glycosyltransferase n=1 Tax=Ramlibacter monticola TaxID=1926872 RepID=A0A936Z536_9BURK|nr:glycosyltransferase [Ramlibacter monticola]
MRRTANSVLTQTFGEFEWLVIDGASSDGTVEFCRLLGPACLCISEPDNGIYDAMRKGLEKASGAYVVFLNAGDELAGPNALGEAVEHLDGANVVFFSTLIRGFGGDRLRRPRPLSAATYSVPAIQQSTFYNVEILRGLQWPVDYKICGDYFLAAQLLRQGCTHRSIPKVVSIFALGGVSTGSFLRLASEAWAVQDQVLGLGLPVRITSACRRVLTGLAVLVTFSVLGRR